MGDDTTDKQQPSGEPTPFDNFATIARKVFSAPRPEVEASIEAEKAKRMKSRSRRKNKLTRVSEEAK
jgi:hypothetical protein